MLVVVHAEQLSLLGRTQTKAGDHVDELRQGGGHDEAVGGAGDDVGQLHIQLLVLVVDPAARDDARVDTVEPDDVVGREEGVEDESDKAADPVLGEHVERVVDAEPELELCRQVARHA